MTQLRQHRDAAGLSQERLAQKAGVSYATIAAIETKGVTPRADTALAIARALGTTVEELFGQEASA